MLTELGMWQSSLYKLHLKLVLICKNWRYRTLAKIFILLQGVEIEKVLQYCIDMHYFQKMN